MLQALIAQLRAQSPVEVAAVAFGLASVWLTRAQSIWCWPTGILNAALLLVVFSRAGLYSEVALQVVFVVSSVYGWWRWLHPGPRRAELPVSRLRPAEGVAWAAALTLAVAVVGALLDRYTDAALPYWDLTSSLLQVVAQILLARKILENWAIWIVADVMLIAINAYKQLYVVAFQFAVFLVLATLGLLAWKKSFAHAAS